MKVFVNVTDWHIGEGNCYDVGNNPVALALREAGYQGATVSHELIQWVSGAKPYTQKVPESVRCFMSKLVGYHEVEPFRFLMPNKGRKI